MTTMIAKQAAWRSQGIDTDTSLLEFLQSASGSLLLPSSGLKFAVRYAGDVTPEEAGAILSAGLLLSLVQHPRTGPLTGSLGSADGLSVVTQAQALGFPAGATIWCDLESWIASVADACNYVNEWSACIVRGGYEAGLYVGWAQVPLSPIVLAGLASTGYWRGCSANIPEPWDIGWQLDQFAPGDQQLGGILVDYDVVKQDFKGRLPTFAAAA
jgi:hypothetical protein